MKFLASAALSLISLMGFSQELRTVGTLLVDVSADSITASDGDAVAQWSNGGTLGGAFVAITNNAGVSFTNSLLGKKAVVFAGASKNALTNYDRDAGLDHRKQRVVDGGVGVGRVGSGSEVGLPRVDGGQRRQLLGGFARDVPL